VKRGKKEPSKRFIRKEKLQETIKFLVGVMFLDERVWTLGHIES
jgi:hypothetical protein